MCPSLSFLDPDSLLHQMVMEDLLQAEVQEVARASVRRPLDKPEVLAIRASIHLNSS